MFAGAQAWTRDPDLETFCFWTLLDAQDVPDHNKWKMLQNKTCKMLSRVYTFNSGSRKRGLSLRGVAFMTFLAVLTVLAVLESTLLSFSLSYKIQDQEATVTVLAVMAVSVMTATPLNSTPLFRDPAQHPPRWNSRDWSALILPRLDRAQHPSSWVDQWGMEIVL